MTGFRFQHGSPTMAPRAILDRNDAVAEFDNPSSHPIGNESDPACHEAAEHTGACLIPVNRRALRDLQ